MNNYDKYYRKGGDYVIPIEIFNDLLGELEELHNKIDKAIEYIEWQRVNPQYDNVWRNFECDKLIEILKDGDVNGKEN